MKQSSTTARASVCAAMDICTQDFDAISLGNRVYLARARVHEVMGSAADLFAVTVAAHTSGAVVWIGQERDLFALAPTSLQQFIDPSRFILVSGVTRDENLWAMQQALLCGGAACVIAELGDGPDLKTSRRLQLAAEEGGTLGIALISGRAQTSAAQTRWSCEPCAENMWNWRLTKNKSGVLGDWRVSIKGEDRASRIVDLVSAPTA